YGQKRPPIMHRARLGPWRRRLHAREKGKGKALGAELVPAQAPNGPPALRLELWKRGVAAPFDVVATFGKRTSRGAVPWLDRRSGDPAGPDCLRAQPGDRLKESTGVRVLRLPKDVLDRTLLDEIAPVHHGNPVDDVADDT